MADKEYKDLTPKEKYDSALEAEKAPWNPIQAAKDMLVEKFSPKKTETKKPVAKKKGGKVKSMCRGGGIEVRGKTRGKMV